MLITKDMIERFLTWPLPASVCADLCATKQGYPHRTGTNLLSADEARQMLEHVLNEVQVRRKNDLPIQSDWDGTGFY